MWLYLVLTDNLDTDRSLASQTNTGHKRLHCSESWRSTFTVFKVIKSTHCFSKQHLLSYLLAATFQKQMRSHLRCFWTNTFFWLRWTATRHNPHCAILNMKNDTEWFSCSSRALLFEHNTSIQYSLTGFLLLLFLVGMSQSQLLNRDNFGIY